VRLAPSSMGWTLPQPRSADDPRARTAQPSSLDLPSTVERHAKAKFFHESSHTVRPADRGRSGP
jgi:hypothetical protein